MKKKGEEKMRNLSKQDLHDILKGCTILGTGGGGSLEEGLELVDKALADGKEFKLVDLDEVPDEGLVISPYMCGSISPVTEEQEKKYSSLPRIKEEQTLRAFKALEDYLEKEIYGVISCELGGGNTAEALYVGAVMGRAIVDGDPAGRSLPELQQSTFFINGITIDPVAVANEFGDVAVFTSVVDDFRAEVLIRALAVVSNNAVGVAGHMAEGSKLKKSVIPGAITYAMDIGRAHRKAKSEGTEPAMAIGGALLFRGKVKQYEWRDEAGFTYGEVHLDGYGDYSGSNYRVWFKNENIMTWKDGKVDVTVPDLVCIFDDQRGEPVINPYYQKGMPLTVIGLPAAKEWRNPRGLELLSPRAFGFDLDYVPIESKYSL